MSDRPSGDMTEAFATALAAAPASEASPASTPVEETPSTDTPAPAATTQAVPETPEPVSANTETEEKPQGEPPKWRWQDILANARETSAKEAEARVRQEAEQKYAWAQVIAEHERDGLLTWRAAMNGDPQAIAHLKANPQVVQWLKGLVTEQAPQADPEPEPDLQTQDGTPVYSAVKQREWREWNNRQILQQVKNELKPYEQERAATQAERQSAAYQTTTSQVIAKMAAADSEFKAHTKQIGEAINADPRLLKLAIGDGMPADPELAIETAWGRVYRATVLPAKQQSSEATVMAKLQRDAVAGVANPSAGAVTQPKTFTTGEQGFADALAHFGGTSRR